MNRKYIIIGIAVIVVLLGISVSFYFYTKSFSPEGVAEYKEGKLEIRVLYGRPFKKGRTVFGGLEPYGKVWRTGANEATIFETNKDLLIKGTLLKAGRYTLWTIPDEQLWTIILNTETGQWGIRFNKEANRDPKRDVVTVQVPALPTEKVTEQFAISVHKTGGELELILQWDKTLVAVPIAISGQ